MTRGRCKLRTDARVRDVYKIGRTLGSGGALVASQPSVLSALVSYLPLPVAFLRAEQTGVLSSV